MIRSQVAQTVGLFLLFLAGAFLLFKEERNTQPLSEPTVVASGPLSWLYGHWEGSNLGARVEGHSAHVALQVEPVSDTRVTLVMRRAEGPVERIPADYDASASRLRFQADGKDCTLDLDNKSHVLAGKLRFDGRSYRVTFYQRGAAGLVGYGLRERVSLLVRELGSVVLRRSLIVGIPYAFLMSILFVVFWGLAKQPWAHKRIQEARGPHRARQESALSFNAVVASAMTNLPWAYLVATGKTRVYTNIADYGWGYFVFSLVLSILLIDAYLFWTHRLLHVPWVFKHFHVQHHMSRRPTPWASLSVSVGETVLNAGFFPLLLTILPTHASIVAVVGIFNLLRNGVNHIGFEVFPRWLSHPALSWNMSVTFHELHHKHVNCNYGCIFTIWDRILGTVHPNTEKVFLEVASRTPVPRDQPISAAAEDLQPE